MVSKFVEDEHGEMKISVLQFLVKDRVINLTYTATEKHLACLIKNIRKDLFRNGFFSVSHEWLERWKKC